MALIETTSAARPFTHWGEGSSTVSSEQRGQQDSDHPKPAAPLGHKQMEGQRKDGKREWGSEEQGKGIEGKGKI